jgi:hypothetical protein
MIPLILECCGHLGCNTVNFLLGFRLKVEYYGTYSFEFLVSLGSYTRNVPGVERDEGENECAFTKLDGIVPTRYQVTGGVDDVVLDEFVVFEVEFLWQVVGQKFRPIVASQFYFLHCRKIRGVCKIWIKSWHTFFVLIFFFFFVRSFFLYSANCSFL